jgi:lysophospholipase L1-like esterase
VCVDGKEVKHYGHDNLTEVASVLEVTLPEGEHTVTVYFPNLFETVIRGVSLDDDASFAPVKRPLRYFAFGDSITQGYIAENPSLTYVNQIADTLNAEVLNLGIGGDVFAPDLIDFDADVAAPNVITVAYGTNDWSKATRERTVTNANKFFARLRTTFPNAKIFAITPIWRADLDRVTDVGTLPDSITDIVTAAASAQPGVTVIRGWELVPHEPELYYDLYLHPNDAGYRYYTKALLEKMTPYFGEIKK